MPTLVAVYGTLKRGGSNFHLLEQAEFIGVDQLKGIVLYDLGPYPGAREELSDGIDIEVYSVNPEQLALLDVLEEYLADTPEQGMYTRKLFTTRFGAAWVYLYNRTVTSLPRINAGSWPQ